MKKILLLFALISSIHLVAQSELGSRKKHFNIEKQLAIKGYDPVAYFVNKKAVVGISDFKYTFEGVDYLFSSAINLNLFKKNPRLFEPEYGGWCAYAMGNTGEKVEVDPTTFKIIDGKLYLFYNKFFTNTLKDWNKNQANLKSNADKNWAITIKK